ncbi:general substrate transporter [Trichoderma pleuroticola]
MAPYLGLSGKPLNFIIGIIGATAFALQGYDQAVGNGILTLKTFLNVFPQTDTLDTKGAQKSHNATIQGTTIAIYEVGCTLGALACVYIGDKLGRIRTVFAAGIVTLVGVAIQTSAFSLGQFIAGRVITGLGLGACTATVPMWISECANAKDRGYFVLLQGLFALGGIVTATWLEFGLFYVKDNAVNWRFPIAFQAVLALIVVSAILFMPESPRWLLKNARTEEASRVLAVLGDTPAESETIAAEIATISSAIEQETNSDGSNNPFAMNHGRYLHRTMLGLGVCFLGEMTGVNIVTFYSTTIFQINLGYSGTTSRVISGCLQIWQLLAAGLAVFLVDRVGRRPLLIVSAAGMAVAHACLAGLTSNLHNKHASDAAIFFYFVALFFFPIGLFLLPFMYAAEIAPLRTRSQVTAMAAAIHWLFGFVIAEVTPVAFANISWRYYIVYASISAFSSAVFYLFYPETRGRTLEEIDEIFTQSRSIFDTVGVAKTLPFATLPDLENEKTPRVEQSE